MRIQMQLQNTVLKILMVLEHGAPDAWPDSVIPPRPVQVCDVAATGHTALQKGPCSKDILLVEKGRSGKEHVNEHRHLINSKQGLTALSFRTTNSKGSITSHSWTFSLFWGCLHGWLSPILGFTAPPWTQRSVTWYKWSQATWIGPASTPTSLVTLGNKLIPLIFSIHKIKGMKQCF